MIAMHIKTVKCFEIFQNHSKPSYTDKKMWPIIANACLYRPIEASARRFDIFLMSVLRRRGEEGVRPTTKKRGGTGRNERTFIP